MFPFERIEGWERKKGSGNDISTTLSPREGGGVVANKENRGSRCDADYIPSRIRRGRRQATIERSGTFVRYKRRPRLYSKESLASLKREVYLHPLKPECEKKSKRWRDWR